MQVNQTLVDAHLVAIPGLGSLTTRRLSGRDAEDLCRETYGALDTELLVLCAVNEVQRD